MLNPLTMKVKRLRDVDPFSLERMDSSLLTREYKWLYFLFHKDELVYIGQSTRHPVSRITAHTIDGVKEFDQYAFLKIRQDLNLNSVEKFFIEKYNPKYNIAHRTNLHTEEEEYNKFKRLSDEQLREMGYSVTRTRIS
jgi:hypothetical protein